MKYEVSTVTQIIKSNTDLSVSKISYLGEGWDNSVFLLNDRLVIRLVKSTAGIQASLAENIVLKNLPHMSLAVPEILYSGEHDGMPWIIYKCIKGNPLYLDHFDENVLIESAPLIGGFLKQLHSLDIEKFSGLRGDLFGHMDLKMRVKFARTKIISLIEKRVIVANDFYEELLEEVEKLTTEGSRQVVCHGDVKSTHILFKEKKISGIIDWGDSHIGHPATDLAIVFTFIPPTAREIFQKAHGETNLDQNLWKLARFRAFYHTLAILDFTHQAGDITRFEDSKRALNWIFED